MKTDFPTASAGSSQAPTAAVEKSQSASNTKIQTLPLQMAAADLSDHAAFDGTLDQFVQCRCGASLCFGGFASK